MKSRFSDIIVLVLVALCYRGSSTAYSQTPLVPQTISGDDEKYTQEELGFFEKKIRPVLNDKCYSCHTAETPKGPKGGLILDTKRGIRKGGDSGPAVVPRNVKSSLILQALKGDKLSLMPPKEKLSNEIIADFEKWIALGAVDPRTDKSSEPTPVIDIQKGREHWSFQPIKKTVPPEGLNFKGTVTPIDKFILAKVETNKLVPNGQADNRTLVRRVYFDLIGLPPTPEQVESFVKDTSTDAFEKLVDKLIATPQFGEKWGRHWLDIARYAESSGKEQNLVYPFAWRYRDYVITSFNKDKPFDQFLREQIAGDLLPHKDDTEKAEHQIATGFLAVGAKSHAMTDRQQFQLDLADEQIDVIGQAMLGLTVACARCHDHKFDPIPTKDYYAIAGIFMSTDTYFGTASGIQARQSAPLVELPTTADIPLGQSHTKRELEQMKTRIANFKDQRDKQREEDKRTGAQPARILFFMQQIATLEKQLSYYEADGKPKKMAMGAVDRETSKDMSIRIRGEVNKLGDTVPRGTLQVVATTMPKVGPKQSGRKEFADWLTSKDNPLPARVMANRIWLQLFGQGIVQTPDNFGKMGIPPTHPELLDYLARYFIDNGWSVKKLIKEVMMSRTYKQSSAHNAANFAIDPDNTFHWKMSKRRLNAEAIRDAMYAVSGQLTLTAPVGSVVQKVEGNVAQFGRLAPAISEITNTTTRSVYIPILRDHVPESLELFDFAEPSLVTGIRKGTSVPSQAHYLLNNAQVMKLAESFAIRIQTKNGTDTEKIDLAFQLAFGRKANESEHKTSSMFLEKFVMIEETSARKTDSKKAAWAAFAQALFATAEFRYLD